MWIYVIQKYDFEFSGLHSAYLSEEEAKAKVETLNAEEEEKNRLYCEWVDNAGDEDDMPPEFGDYRFSFRKVWLETANKNLSFIGGYR